MPALALLLALAGAPASAADSDPITFEPIGIEDVRVGFGDASFEVVVRAERTRGVPVHIRSLDYALSVERVTVAQSQRDYRDDPVKLKKGEPVVFRVPVELNAAEALAVLGNTLKSGGGVRVRLSGKAKARLLIFPVSLPFRTDLVNLKP